MLHHLLSIGADVAAALAICGIAYYILCIKSAAAFLGDCRQAQPGSFMPPVSIIKPLRGADPEMYEAFRSHCLQEYPEYELIFGVAEENDPAIALVERLQREFPQRSIRLIMCPRVLGANLKVSNLVQMLPAARFEFLVVNDSDIRVPADYLRRVMAPFATPQTGLVTALYRGAATGMLSRMEAIGISTDFAAGVLAARELEGIRFGLGSTLAFPRRVLDDMGGFEPVLDYLADDYEIGARIAAQGHPVMLSEVVVDTYLPDYSLGEYWNHQLRWARTLRHARKWGYLGMGTTFGVPWALLAVALAHGATWSWVLAAVALVLRGIMAFMVGTKVLRDPLVVPNLWLLPLRDLLGLLFWGASFTGRTIDWRGDQFTLKHGQLSKMPRPM
jgi:ceramide glucosyltransferase